MPKNQKNLIILDLMLDTLVLKILQKCNLLISSVCIPCDAYGKISL